MSLTIQVKRVSKFDKLWSYTEWDQNGKRWVAITPSAANAIRKIGIDNLDWHNLNNSPYETAHVKLG